MTPRRTALRVALAASALLAACQDAPLPTGPDRPDLSSVVRTPQGQTPDQAALARAIPGFGGLFLAADGAPTVYLTDDRQRGATERALAGFLRAHGASTLRVVRGRYGYGQLERWFAQAAPEALAVTGAVFADLDEANNRLLIGAEPGAVANVRASVARLGIPAEALVVVETEPIQFMATLRDQVRPVQAGLQINFGNFLCTLGFNAIHGSGASFITNSHCTNTQGGTEGTQYHQPLASTSGSFIGTEAADPTYVRNLPGCPRGKKCRRSDASRAAYAPGVNQQLGRIARTTGANNGSITIDAANPFFTITAEQGGTTFVVGTTVSKVGRTTGWTRGAITNSCVTTTVSGSNVALICQTFVSAGVGAGDSGSPVFADAGGNATLYGILWGGTSSGASFVFSPLAAVEQELGALTTF